MESHLKQKWPPRPAATPFRAAQQEFPLIDATNDTGWRAINTFVAICRIDPPCPIPKY